MRVENESEKKARRPASGSNHTKNHFGNPSPGMMFLANFTAGIGQQLIARANGIGSWLGDKLFK